MALIQAEQLSKVYARRTMEPGFKGMLRSLLRARYQRVDAVHDVSFTIARGEMVGYIGPNGAGKSTTIKMLCGVLLPSAGLARVDGHDPFLDRTRNAANIGAVFGQRNHLSIDLPAVDTYRSYVTCMGLHREHSKTSLNMYVTHCSWTSSGTLP